MEECILANELLLVLIEGVICGDLTIEKKNNANFIHAEQAIVSDSEVPPT